MKNGSWSRESSLDTHIPGEEIRRSQVIEHETLEDVWTAQPIKGVLSSFFACKKSGFGKWGAASVAENFDIDLLTGGHAGYNIYIFPYVHMKLKIGMT